MDNTIEEYRQLRAKGAAPEEIYVDAKTKYGDKFNHVSLLRTLFGMSRLEATEIMRRADEIIFERDILPRYSAMKSSGSNPAQVYKASKADEGLSQIERIKILRLVFDISLIEAMKVINQE